MIAALFTDYQSLCQALDRTFPLSVTIDAYEWQGEWVPYLSHHVAGAVDTSVALSIHWPTHEEALNYALCCASDFLRCTDQILMRSLN